MRVLRSLLFEVTPYDASTYAVIALVCGGAAMLATLIPACRAMRIQALEALRAEKDHTPARAHGWHAADLHGECQCCSS